jgi:hypothetical protein
MPEQLALDQVLGQGPAVEGHHERAAAAGSELVDRPGPELLAGPRLALEQDRDLAVGRELEHREQLAHGQALADQLAEAPARTRGQAQAVGLGLDAQVAVAEPQGGPGPDGRLVYGRALEPSPVFRAEVAHDVARLRGTDLQVPARDPGIDEHEIAARIAADHDRPRAEGQRSAHARALDDDQLDVPGAAVGDGVIGVGRGDRRHGRGRVARGSHGPRVADGERRGLRSRVCRLSKFAGPSLRASLRRSKFAAPCYPQRVNLPPRLGPYAILERLGVGGMAEVHLARRFGASGWEKLVALKTLRPERRGEPELERMLVAEARIAAMFAHPGLIGVLTSASPTASTTCAWTTSTGPTSRRC